jgi:hypothetical protein
MKGIRLRSARILIALVIWLQCVRGFFKVPSYPDVFLFGAPKCGTTATFAVLVNHEAFCHPASKEPTFFGTEDVAKGEDFYRAYFNASQPHTCRLSFDATPYFGFILGAIPDIVSSYEPSDLKTKKFIIILREPAKRFFSWYDMQVRASTLHVKEVIASTKPEQLVDHLGVKYEGYPLSRFCTQKEINWGCHDISTKSRYVQHPELLFRSFERYYNSNLLKGTKPSCYKPQLELLWASVPRANTFIVNFDSLVKNTTSVFEGIAKFLGVANSWKFEELEATSM